MPDLYIARRPFKYGPNNLDAGQVLELGGLRNDDVLTRVGYLEPYASKSKPVECNQCGQKFIDLGALQRHGARAHTAKTAMNPMEEDRLAEREERTLAEIAPLYMNQTAAAKGVKAESKRGRRA